MKELTIEEIRKIQIEGLKCIANICEKNKLNYFLTCGSLLGAVKYQGYIPWDDDIDIGLKREEYLKLIDILEKNPPNDYKVLTIYNTKDYYYPYAKLVSTKTKVIENTKSINELGVYIDIFPFDYYKEDYEEYMHKIRFFRNMTVNRYRIKTHIEKSMNLTKNYAKIKFKNLKKIIYDFVDIISIPLGHNFWAKRYDKLVSKNKKGKYLTIGCRNYVKLNSKLFDEFIEYNFENYKFKSIKNADIFLKKIYGDYMKDLPKEQQRTHHQIHAYWRNK